MSHLRRLSQHQLGWSGLRGSDTGRKSVAALLDFPVTPSAISPLYSTMHFPSQPQVPYRSD